MRKWCQISGTGDLWRGRGGGVKAFSDWQKGGWDLNFLLRSLEGGCSLGYIVRVVHCPRWVLCKVTILQLYVSWILIITRHIRRYTRWRGGGGGSLRKYWIKKGGSLAIYMAWRGVLMVIFIFLTYISSPFLLYLNVTPSGGQLVPSNLIAPHHP